MNHRHTPVAALTSGAVLAATAVLLALAVQYLPVAGALFYFAVPVPPFLATVRHGARLGLLTTIVATAILLVFTGPLVALLYTLPQLLTGWLIGVGHLRHFGFWLQAVGASAITLVALLAGFVTASLFAAEGTFTQTVHAAIAAWDTSVKTAAAVYERAGLPQEAQLLQQTAAQVRPFLFHYAWAMVGLAAIVGGLLLYFATRLLVRRFHYELPGPPPLPPFATWALPAWSILVMPIAVGALYLGERVHGPLLTGATVLWNVAWLVFQVIGLATLYFFLRRWRLAKLLAVIVTVYVWFIPVTSILLGPLGLWETVARMRDQIRRRREDEGHPEGQGEGAG